MLGRRTPNRAVLFPRRRSDAILAPVHAQPFPHHPECHTARCASHADREWAKRHRPPFHLSAFESCVVEHESGFDKDASNGVDLSYYQWEPATYASATAMAGITYRYPTDASLREQTLAFRAYEPSHPGAWPVTVPECGG